MNEIKKIWLSLSDRFYRVAYHILESQEDAEDAVQELYLKLMRTPTDSQRYRIRQHSESQSLEISASISYGGGKSEGRKS